MSAGHPALRRLPQWWPAPRGYGGGGRARALTHQYDAGWGALWVSGAQHGGPESHRGYQGGTVRVDTRVPVTRQATHSGHMLKQARRLSRLKSEKTG